MALWMCLRGSVRGNIRKQSEAGDSKASGTGSVKVSAQGLVSILQ